ncbi:hypothetical protein N0V88_003379 [Collariella sp. IMI 366227]|nr:hypothetical protein N0V88_003379 [Collariella sp. IMI 366227]
MASPAESSAQTQPLPNRPESKLPQISQVSSGASFMSLVKRVRTGLENVPSLQANKGMPLTARVAALRGWKQPGGRVQQQGVPVEDGLDDVVLVATGRAIQKAVEVGGFFTRERDLVVLVRTRTVQAVDDVVAEDEEADVEDQVRVRNLSCVEVGIRRKSKGSELSRSILSDEDAVR